MPRNQFFPTCYREQEGWDKLESYPPSRSYSVQHDSVRPPWRRPHMPHSFSLESEHYSSPSSSTARDGSKSTSWSRPYTPISHSIPYGHYASSKSYGERDGSPYSSGPRPWESRDSPHRFAIEPLGRQHLEDHLRSGRVQSQYSVEDRINAPSKYGARSEEVHLRRPSYERLRPSANIGYASSTNSHYARQPASKYHYQGEVHTEGRQSMTYSSVPRGYGVHGNLGDYVTTTTPRKTITYYWRDASGRWIQRKNVQEDGRSSFNNY